MAPNPKKEEAAKAPAATKSVPVESVYSTACLADNHQIFGVSREIVVMALRNAEKDYATAAEAKIIIDTFKTKEVK